MDLYDALSNFWTDPVHLTVGILSISIPLLWHLRRGKQTQAQGHAPPSWPFDPASLDRKEVFASISSYTLLLKEMEIQFKIDLLCYLPSPKAKSSLSATQ
jgi:hypothetical protein